MNRLVYLFELDSVKKHEGDAKGGMLYTPAVNALLCEIIKRGNIVAITMNQLTDSQLIREALADDAAYGCLLELFALGTVRVSLYSNIRTASQYVQNAVEKCLADNSDSFIFSNLPVKSDDKALLCEIRDALRFSDLARLQELLEAADGAQRDNMKLVYRFINMILQLSVCETSNIPPKTGERRSFEAFLEEILRALSTCDPLPSPYAQTVKQAVAMLRERGKHITDGRANRSNWLTANAQHGSAEHMANELIHLCYNYTVEDSVNGVSKHYDDHDFEATFRRDLIRRVLLLCRQMEADHPPITRAVPRTQWRTAVRFAKYRASDKRRTANEATVAVYEDGLRRERWLWLLILLKKNDGALCMALIYIAVFCIVELGTNWMEDHFSLQLNNLFVSSLVSVLMFGVLGSLIGIGLRFVNRGDDVPDILQSIMDIVIHFCDFWRALGGRYDSYRSN